MTIASPPLRPTSDATDVVAVNAREPSDVSTSPSPLSLFPSALRASHARVLATSVRNDPLGVTATTGACWNDRCKRRWRPRPRSAVKHQPADVVPHPLVVKYELADRLREQVTLPLALKSACGFALGFRRGSTYGLDGIGGRTELVRGHVRYNPRF